MKAQTFNAKVAKATLLTVPHNSKGITLLLCYANVSNRSRAATVTNADSEFTPRVRIRGFYHAFYAGRYQSHFNLRKVVGVNNENN